MTFQNSGHCGNILPNMVRKKGGSITHILGVGFLPKKTQEKKLVPNSGLGALARMWR